MDAGGVTRLMSQLGAQDSPSWSLPRPPSIRSLGPAPLLPTLDPDLHLALPGGSRTPLGPPGLTITPG